MTHKNEATYTSYFENADALNAAIAAARELSISEETRQIFEDIDSVNVDLIAIEEQLLANPDIEQAVELYRGRYGDLKVEYAQDIEQFFDLQRAELDTQIDNIFAEINQIIVVSLVLLVVMLIISFGAALILTRTISNPLSQLVEEARQIASGDFSHRVDVNTQDELGVLGDTFNAMASQVEEEIASVETRIRYLATTVEVGTLVTGINTQEELLPAATEFIRSRFDLYYTQIYLLDETGRFALLRSGTGDVGQQLLARQHRLDTDGRSLVATAVQTRQSVLVSDTESSDIHSPNALLPDTRSEIAIPLLVGDEVLGVLDMQADVVDTFNEDNLPVFEAMASQVASALHSTQAYSEIQVAIERAEQLNERITSQNWRGYLGSLGDGAKVQYEFDVFGSGKLRLLDDKTNLHDIAQDMQDKHGLHAAVKLGGQNIGRIVVREEVEREWTDEERQLLEDAAERLGQAAEQFRSFDAVETSRQEIERRAVEMETVAQVSAAATTTLDMGELLKSVADLTKAQFNLYHSHIYLLDGEGQNLILTAGAGNAGDIMVENGHQILLNHPRSLVALAARGRKGTIADDVTKSEDFLPNPLLPDTRSEMAIPMIVGDDLIGVLDAQAIEIARFDENEVQVFTALASQIAVAVENARAFEREQETVERLREVDQLKSQFLANMSHELRTPLNSIIGYAGILVDGAEGELPEEAVEDIDIIHQSGKHLLAIINDILDLAKIEARELKLRFVPTDMPKILEEVIRSGQVLATEKNITLEVIKDSDIPQVKVDAVRMRQITWNLVSNAMKFTEQGGVTVRYGMLNEEEIYVRIEDTGMGIPEEHLGQVFERFRQVDESSTRSAGGTGLGLTITRELIQMHGGDIYAESEVGVGSTFWFKLPIAVEETDATSEISSLPTS
ncbi:MAG: GAF domain-containing protein [Anaerolineae bacterium]|nr:GAF domain-containing protein [Anaerolineae bacterium]